jgi:hypothetical protein
MVSTSSVEVPWPADRRQGMFCSVKPELGTFPLDGCYVGPWLVEPEEVRRSETFGQEECARLHTCRAGNFVIGT